ncbi:hypothetical protein HYW83_02645 [Candidatus Peregrinibacteria bacterium]|nr:hypothetical protein [Candidatus Peregrinibacteria bacterium]
MKKKRTLSHTPRRAEHSRKVHFSLAMREKVSENWVALRKELRGKKKTKRRR